MAKTNKKQADVYAADIESSAVNPRDAITRKLLHNLPIERKAALGQFMTPPTVARFMAGLFQRSRDAVCRLLDAGAGAGALSCAFLDRWRSGDLPFKGVELTAYEIDERMQQRLTDALLAYPDVPHSIMGGDFIEQASVGPLFHGGYTHAILNPPYKKINSNSSHRLALREVGIETVNLYSAFVALAVVQAAPGGQIVAIIPRSFCNGPYYRPFRDFILERAALRHIHLFESRTQAFKEDEVLQENVIIRLERGTVQGPVTISTSTDDSFQDLVCQEHPFDRIVFPGDPERFIHVPTTLEKSAFEQSGAITHSLEGIGLKVSTGPVVDFRLREHLRQMPGPGTVPLLYAGHFAGMETAWPAPESKKPNAIERNSETEKWLFPNGFYCVVRRFSSKEERRRVMASVIDPKTFGKVTALGLENHLNVYHEAKRGLPEALARGLAVFLNTTAVDEQFRRFNGHTQVNATDLKQLKYPSRQILVSLGEWAKCQPTLSQEAIDEKFGALTHE